MQSRKDWTLEILLLLYSSASLLHFIHNAEFVTAYPNLPAWITRSSVYATWIGIAAVGLVGYGLYRLNVRAIGLVVLGVYAGAGLDGLLHYTRAPMGDHTQAMNFTIWLEAAMAAVLLVYLIAKIRRQRS